MQPFETKEYMTDTNTTIFDSTPSKSRFLVPTLTLIGAYVAFQLITNLSDEMRRRAYSISQSWAILLLFLSIPLAGGILLYFKRKLGWYCSVVYFLFFSVAGIMVQSIRIIKYHQYGIKAVIQLRTDVMVLTALAITILLMTRDMQETLAISVKQRNWTLVVASFVSLIQIISILLRT